jgi:hypothetical protein
MTASPSDACGMEMDQWDGEERNKAINDGERNREGGRKCQIAAVESSSIVGVMLLMSFMNTSRYWSTLKPST